MSTRLDRFDRARRTLAVVGALLLSLWTTRLCAQPANDACVNATVVCPGSIAGNNASATLDGGVSICASTTGHDVWYRYTPGATGNLMASLCAGMNMVVSLHYATCPANASNQLACASGPCGAFFNAQVVGGITYLVRVASPGTAAGGAFTLTLTGPPCGNPGPPPNDACANAETICASSGSTLTVVGNNSLANASADGSVATGCASSTSRDVWYRYIAGGNGMLNISMCGDDAFDSVLSVHTGCPGTSSNQIGCNNDFCGPSSFVSVSVTAGTVYRIRVASLAATPGGPFLLDVTGPECIPAPANDNCASATALSGTSGTVTGTTLAATNDGTASCGSSNSSPDVWYTFTPSTCGVLSLDTCGSAFNTVLSVYAGACPGTEVVCNNNCALSGVSCNGTLQSCLTLGVSGGTAYRIRVSGVNGASGNYTLSYNLATPSPPSSPLATPSTICLGQSSSLTATVGAGETVDWFTTACGSVQVGTGSPLVVTPSVSTTYFARTRNTTTGCVSATCASVTVTVNIPAVPTNVQASPATICAGASSTLSASAQAGLTIDWFTGSCGGTPSGSGASLIVSPAATTTYFARARNTLTGCTSTTCGQVTVTVNPVPAAPTNVAAAPDTVCLGAPTFLSATVPAGVAVDWFSPGCGTGTPLGTGATFSVTPTVSTTYFARARIAATGCTSATCGFVTVTVTPDNQPPTIANCQPNQTLTTNSSCDPLSLPPLYWQMNITDNCTPPANLNYTQSPLAGTLLACGTATPVTVTVSDVAGNTATCQTSVFVQPSGGPPSQEACCFTNQQPPPTKTCTMLDPIACTSFGGQPMGPGSRCVGDGFFVGVADGEPDACFIVPVPPSPSQGGDAWNTPTCGAEVDFCQIPIPADFFDPGSLPFNRVIRLTGSLGSAPDTRVARLWDLGFSPHLPSCQQTPVEITFLDLTSCIPITIQYAGAPDELWDVRVGLSTAAPQPPGLMDVCRTHENGGWFHAEFGVISRFIFTRQSNQAVRILDTGLPGSILPPIELATVGQAPFVMHPNPSLGGSFAPNFVPGVDEDASNFLQQCCKKVGHAANAPLIPGGPPATHLHETYAPITCDDCSKGACCTSGTCQIVANIAACTAIGGDFKGPGSDCKDDDNDGLANVIEKANCCLPGGDPCNVPSNPHQADTDGDGCLDGDEVMQGSDPCDRCYPVPSCIPPVTDCNNNGREDDCDIQTGSSADLNHDGIPDECQGAACSCPGDLNGDHIRDGRDIKLLVACILNGGNCPCADMDGNGIIDTADLASFVSSLLAGAACP